MYSDGQNTHFKQIKVKTKGLNRFYWHQIFNLGSNVVNQSTDSTGGSIVSD